MAWREKLANPNGGNVLSGGNKVGGQETTALAIYEDLANDPDMMTLNERCMSEAAKL